MKKWENIVFVRDIQLKFIDSISFDVFLPYHIESYLFYYLCFSQSDVELPTNSNESEEATNPKPSSSTVISPTDVNESGNSNDQKEATASDPEKASEIKHTNPSSNSSESEEEDKVKEDKSDEEDGTKMDHSGSSNEQPTNSQETPASQTKPNKSDQSKADPNPRPFETTDITSIRYKDENEPDLLEAILENATDPRLLDRLLGCVYGQALGDAYGLSTEFEDRDDVARKYPNCSLIPFPDYVLTGHNRRWMRGDWTDDTDQWILVLLTLMFHDGNERVFAQKLTNWIYRGYQELGDHGGMGLGANVSQVIRHLNKDRVQFVIKSFLFPHCRWYVLITISMIL